MSGDEDGWVHPQGQTMSDLAYGRSGHQAAPGMLVELEGGESALVGDVNVLGGVCDDCTLVPPSTLVVRYRTVWSRGR